MRRVTSVLLLLVISACAHDSRRPAEPPTTRSRNVSRGRPEPAHPVDTAPALRRFDGEASYYSDHLAGRRTASGEPYRPRDFTAAHRDLPLGTILRVTRSDGKGSVVVRVNDRGPYGSRHRILDLSRAAFEQLARPRAGVVEVHAEVIAYGVKRGH